MLMKKFITLLLVLTGMVSTASAYSVAVKGTFDSWTGTSLDVIDGDEWVIKLPGSKLQSNDIEFKLWIDDTYWRGPSSAFTFTTPNGSSDYYTNEEGGGNFKLEKNTSATSIYIYVKFIDNNGGKTKFRVVPLVVTSYTDYPIKFSSTWGSVNAYSYYNDIPLQGIWPGESLSSTSGSCSATLHALPGSKVIFTNGLGGDDNKTVELDIVRNGVYSKANGLSHITVAISDAGYATFSSEKSLNFNDQGVNAYVASISLENKVVLSKHNKVPYNNGVLLKGDEGTYDIPITDSPDDISTNKLMASVTETAVAASTAGTYHYVLANSSGIGFYNVATATTSGAGKAYLETDVELASEASARVAWVFDDESTGIENVKQNVKANNEYFNIAGQRDAQPTKGLYIVNGKKVIIK